jgi:hypothetical protein
MIFDPVNEVEFSRIEASDQTGNGGAQTEVLT